MRSSLLLSFDPCNSSQRCLGAEVVSPHSADEKDEAQRGQAACSRLLSVLVSQPGLELRSP